MATKNDVAARVNGREQARAYGAVGLPAPINVPMLTPRQRIERGEAIDPDTLSDEEFMSLFPAFPAVWKRIAPVVVVSVPVEEGGNIEEKIPA